MYREHTPAELDLLKQAHICTKTHINDTLGNHEWLIFEARIPMLDCDEDKDKEERLDPLEFVRSVMKKYHRVYFVGDSIMGQQFTLMKFMLDPESTEPHYDLPVEFDHTTNTISVISGASLASDSFPLSATHMEWVKWGYRKLVSGTKGSLDAKYKVFYKEELPDIMAKATENDAVIIDAAVHYNHERMQMMEEALEFIREQSMMTKASVYYGSTSSGVQD